MKKWPNAKISIFFYFHCRSNVFRVGQQKNAVAFAPALVLNSAVAFPYFYLPPKNLDFSKKKHSMEKSKFFKILILKISKLLKVRNLPIINKQSSGLFRITFIAEATFFLSPFEFFWYSSGKIISGNDLSFFLPISLRSRKNANFWKFQIGNKSFKKWKFEKIKKKNENSKKF